jgi:hypothetical protein
VVQERADGLPGMCGGDASRVRRPYGPDSQHEALHHAKAVDDQPARDVGGLGLRLNTLLSQVHVGVVLGMNYAVERFEGVSKLTK